jgi:hypothetical protein
MMCATFRRLRSLFSEHHVMTEIETGSAVESPAGFAQKYALTLATEFPRSFRRCAELVVAARRCLRLVRSGHPDMSVRYRELLDGLEELRARLLFENFYYRALELGIESPPDLVRLARTSSDWRVVQFLSLLETDYPQFSAEYDFMLNLLAANSPALEQVRLGETHGTMAA